MSDKKEKKDKGDKKEKKDKKDKAGDDGPLDETKFPKTLKHGGAKYVRFNIDDKTPGYALESDQQNTQRQWKAKWEATKEKLFFSNVADKTQRVWKLPGTEDLGGAAAPAAGAADDGGKKEKKEKKDKSDKKEKKDKKDKDGTSTSASRPDTPTIGSPASGGGQGASDDDGNDDGATAAADAADAQKKAQEEEEEAERQKQAAAEAARKLAEEELEKQRQQQQELEQQKQKQKELEEQQQREREQQEQAAAAAAAAAQAQREEDERLERQRAEKIAAQEVVDKQREEARQREEAERIRQAEAEFVRQAEEEKQARLEQERKAEEAKRRQRELESEREAQARREREAADAEEQRRIQEAREDADRQAQKERERQAQAQTEAERMAAAARAESERLAAQEEEEKKRQQEQEQERQRQHQQQQARARQQQQEQEQEEADRLTRQREEEHAAEMKRQREAADEAKRQEQQRIKEEADRQHCEYLQQEEQRVRAAKQQQQQGKAAAPSSVSPVTASAASSSTSVVVQQYDDENRERLRSRLAHFFDAFAPAEAGNIGRLLLINTTESDLMSQMCSRYDVSDKQETLMAAEANVLPASHDFGAPCCSVSGGERERLSRRLHLFFQTYFPGGVSKVDSAMQLEVCETAVFHNLCNKYEVDKSEEAEAAATRGLYPTGLPTPRPGGMYSSGSRVRGQLNNRGQRVGGGQDDDPSDRREDFASVRRHRAEAAADFAAACAKHSVPTPMSTGSPEIDGIVAPAFAAMEHNKYVTDMIERDKQRLLCSAIDTLMLDHAAAALAASKMYQDLIIKVSQIAKREVNNSRGGTPVAAMHNNNQQQQQQQGGGGGGGGGGSPSTPRQHSVPQTQPVQTELHSNLQNTSASHQQQQETQIVPSYWRRILTPPSAHTAPAVQNQATTQMHQSYTAGVAASPASHINHTALNTSSIYSAAASPIPLTSVSAAVSPGGGAAGGSPHLSAPLTTFLQWDSRRSGSVLLSADRTSARMIPPYNSTELAAAGSGGHNDTHQPSSNVSIVSKSKFAPEFFLIGTIGIARGEFVFEVNLELPDGGFSPDNFFAIGVASKYYRGPAGRKCMSYMLRSDGSLLTHSDSNVGISYTQPLGRRCTVTAHLNLNKWEMAFHVNGVPLGTAFRFSPTQDPEPLFPVACFGATGGTIELQKPTAAQLPDNVSPSRIATWPELNDKGLPAAMQSPGTPQSMLY